MTAHPSKLALDRHLLGESDHITRAHVADCTACAESLRLMESDDRAFLIAHPTPASVDVVPEPRRTSGWWFLPGLALAASMASVLLLPADQNRLKGASHVELLVRRGDDTFRYVDQPLRQGDTLLFRYSTLKRHMLVAGVEDSGEVSIFAADVVIEPGQARIAPQGVRLDDHSGRERVVLFLSEQPIEPGSLHRSLSYDRSPAAPPGAEGFTWVIERASP